MLYNRWLIIEASTKSLFEIDILYASKEPTTLLLGGAHNLIRVGEVDEWKTVSTLGMVIFIHSHAVWSYQCSNSLQQMENDLFRELFVVFVIIYLDNILIFSKTLSEHQGHVCEVLQKICELGLYAKIEKCQFLEDSV